MTNVNPEPTDEPVFGDDPPQARVLFGNKTYDRLKFAATILFPAFAVFYSTLGDLWGFPKTQEVVGTIVALDLFLGLLLGLSTRQYENSGAKYAGSVHVSQVIADDGETPLTQVGVGFKDSMSGEQLEQRKEITLKVINE